MGQGHGCHAHGVDTLAQGMTHACHALGRVIIVWGGIPGCQALDSITMVWCRTHGCQAHIRGTLAQGWCEWRAMWGGQRGDRRSLHVYYSSAASVACHLFPAPRQAGGSSTTGLTQPRSCCHTWAATALRPDRVRGVPAAPRGDALWGAGCLGQCHGPYGLQGGEKRVCTPLVVP